MLEFDHGRPGAGLDFRQHIADALTNSSSMPVRLLAGFAYATRAGVEELVSALEEHPRWQQTAKQWLLSVHHGITEPVAITSLATLPKSEVRLAVCGQSIQNAVVGPRIFHAKVIAVDLGDDHAISTLIAGSANLTGAAIGSRARNFEAGLAWKSAVEADVSEQFGTWWSEAWSGGIAATPKAIDDYIKERDKFLVRNPDVLLETSAPGADELMRATMLWIEAGKMSGQSRNQVEFNGELAAFFGDISAKRRLLTFTAGRRTWDERPLSPKKTGFGVRIWRLSLPTAAQGGFVYPGRTILILKDETPTGTRYRLSVADSESPKAKGWRKETHQVGVVGRTGGGRSGGRSYGFR